MKVTFIIAVMFMLKTLLTLRRIAKLPNITTLSNRRYSHHRWGSESAVNGISLATSDFHCTVHFTLNFISNFCTEAIIWLKVYSIPVVSLLPNLTDLLLSLIGFLNNNKSRWRIGSAWCRCTHRVANLTSNTLLHKTAQPPTASCVRPYYEIC